MVGNCFSLQKEHDTALKFFQRAIQLQPTLAYAYTLSGHEYSANDDFEKAMACYRAAIRIDERHYNAWYGLGNIYFRQVRVRVRVRARVRARIKVRTRQHLLPPGDSLTVILTLTSTSAR